MAITSREQELTITLNSPYNYRDDKSHTTQIVHDMQDEQVVTLQIELDGHMVTVTLNPARRTISDDVIPSGDMARDDSYMTVHIDRNIALNIAPANDEIYGKNALLYQTWKYIHCPGEEQCNPQSGMDSNVVFMDDIGEPGIAMDSSLAYDAIKRGEM